MFSLASYGEGISGGDRIYIEFARRWGKKIPITIFVWEEGYRMCRRQHLEISEVKFIISKLKKWRRFGFLVCYVVRIFEGIKLGFSLKQKDNKQIVYSSSEFLMDVLPAFILKLRFPKIKWVATWFQTAPNPLRGFAEGEREEKYRLNALLYWLVQLMTKPLISGFSDYVLVNNEEERKQFPRHDRHGRIIVVLGAVDSKKIKGWISRTKNYPKIYDAVFQGRFHAQKGVVELIEIWKKVVEKKQDAVLAMIGDGPLMNNVRLAINNYQLLKNVKLFGYVFDGPKKYKIFSQSKMVVHPAFYDSGGMASAEAMAFDIPCVGFDLPAYKSYYPNGMLKVEIGNLNQFANSVINLISNKRLREKIGKDAGMIIGKYWSWDYRAEEVLGKIS